MLPFKRSFVREIAGDNASYKRQSIDPYEHVWRNGFWEPAVHTELEKAGLDCCWCLPLSFTTSDPLVSGSS